MASRHHLIRLLASKCIVLSLTVLSTASCSPPTASTRACTSNSSYCSSCTVIDHPKPELTVDREPFMNAGCVADEDNSQAVCAETTLLAQLGCQAVKFDDLLGGLDPHEPIATCLTSASPSYQLGTTRHVIYRDGRYQLLTPEELHARYAPLESDAEALSYVLAMTDYQVMAQSHAKYDLNHICESFYVSYRPLVPQIEETHVEPLENGYRVYLFDYGSLQFIESVVFDVTPDGTITEHSRQRVAEMF